MNIIRTVLKAAAILAVAACAVFPAQAQEYVSTPVSISKEKVKINGRICYSHIVLEKQTLYSIAKAYNVSVDDIYALNPTLKETGLKKNSIILIPSAETVRSSQPSETKVAETSAETLDVTEKQSGQKKQKTHVRKWYEDLDAIAEKYGVSAEAIMKANKLTGKKLANRQKLIIPSPGEYTDGTEAEETVTEIITKPADSVADIEQPADSLKQDEEPEWIFRPKDKVEMTLILPLQTNAGNPSRNNLDFYSGVLLAVNDLAENGISTELNVYDLSDKTHPVTNEDVSDSDIIIGPVSSGDLGRILSSTGETFIVSPLDPRAESLVWTNSNFIQAPTPHKSQYEDLVRWIEEDSTDGDKVLVISEKGARQTEAMVQMKEIIDSSSVEFIPFSYSILEGRDVINPLKGLMTETGTNRVMIASESEAFVNDVVRNLNILIHGKMNVVLYAPSKIRGFETIEVENLHNTSLHVSLGYYIDYDDPRVKNFLLKYRALYNTEPTQFAFQGYDMASYFIHLCSRYGERWNAKLEKSEKSMLQSTFRFVEVEDGGYINHGIRRIVYGKDWSVNKIR